MTRVDRAPSLRGSNRTSVGPGGAALDGDGLVRLATDEAARTGSDATRTTTVGFVSSDRDEVGALTVATIVGWVMLVVTAVVAATSITIGAGAVGPVPGSLVTDLPMS